MSAPLPECKTYSVWQQPRAFAEFAVVQAKHNQVNGAIDHIIALYQSMRADELARRGWPEEAFRERFEGRYVEAYASR